MRHKKREWEPSESHCPTPMASSSAYSCPLHGKGFSRTSNCPYPVLSEPILRHLISSSHPSTKSSVFSNFKTHLSMAILLPWGRKNVYIFLVVGRHSTARARATCNSFQRGQQGWYLWSRAPTASAALRARFCPSCLSLHASMRIKTESMAQTT